ncbi:MAG TPA: hypothetical protein VLJ17_13995 [Xanthobacteraceae bacterium]|nr:hypothetical protein [Xanthobacteraceae bacterium]
MAGLLVALALTLPSAAVAAQPKGKQFEPPKLTHPMQVVIVADDRDGCEPNCAEWVSAEGEIAPDTPAQFRRVFKTLGHKKLPIFISSSGGAAEAALAIGREIRKRGLDVAVERTIFQKCEPSPSTCDRRTLKDGDKGRPEAIGAYCASACVFILAAGVERVVPVYGFVGVHQLIQFQTYHRVWRTYRVQRRFENGRPVEVSRELISEKPLSSTVVEKDPNYAPVRAYLDEMGVDTAAIMPLIMATPHTDVHRMTPEERRTTRLVTRVTTGAELLAAATQPSATGGAASKPLPVALQAVVAPSQVFADLTLFYPPVGHALDIYVRLRSSDPQFRTDGFSADVEFPGGKTLIARSTGSRPVDPLYATLTSDEFCAVRRSGDLSVKLILNGTANWGLPQRFAFDPAKSPGFAEFAAKHCSK